MTVSSLGFLNNKTNPEAGNFVGDNRRIFGKIHVMDIRTFIGVLGLAAIFALTTVGCKTTDQPGSTSLDPTVQPGDNPPDVTGFLQTGPGKLSDWMDERFNVKYRAMTPQLIFEQVPLDEIHYQTTNLPSNAPVFNYQSPDISRRELLKKIADHWNLTMGFVIGEDGQPAAVNVSG